MSHNVESMMYAGETPWHGLGVAVPSNVAWTEALTVAGLDWAVTLKRAFVRGRDASDGSKRAVETEGYRAVLRETDETFYAMVSDRYQPIQNREAFALFGELFGDAAVLHTAGSLRGGRIVWGLAEFPETFTVGSDEHRRFLLVTTRHDGSGSLRAFPTAVRVVCNNTLNLAFRCADSGIAIRHTGDVAAKLRQQGSVLGQALGLFDEYRENASKLLDVILTAEESRELVSELVNAESARGQRGLDTILRLADRGQGNAPYRGTGYALFQGVTEYVDHVRLASGDGDRRFETTALGSGAVMKHRALKLLLDRALKTTAHTAAPESASGRLLNDVIAASV